MDQRERSALQAIANARQQAATVLQERRQQSSAHQLQRPAALPLPDVADTEDTDNTTATSNNGDDSAPLAEQASEEDNSNAAHIAHLQQCLQTLHSERQQAQQHLGQHQLAKAQDDARRQQSADLLQEMQQQQHRQRIWAQLNDLIGSQDGKNSAIMRSNTHSMCCSLMPINICISWRGVTVCNAYATAWV
jgi:exonuclease SbcC